MSSNIEIVPSMISGDLMDGVERPMGDGPIVQGGERRMVPLIPTPFGSRPAIWISRYCRYEAVEDGGPQLKVKKCVVLMSSDPPETGCITIEAEAIKLFPKVPVEW